MGTPRKKRMERRLRYWSRAIFFGSSPVKPSRPSTAAPVPLVPCSVSEHFIPLQLESGPEERTTAASPPMPSSPWVGVVFGLQPLRTKQLLIEDLACHTGVALEVQSRAVLPRDDSVGGFMVWGLPTSPLSSSSSSGRGSSLLVFPEVPMSQEWNYNGGRHYLIQ